MNGNLRPGVLSSRQNVRSVDVQGIVAGITLVRPVLGVIKLLNDGITTALGLDLALLLQTVQKGVVLRQNCYRKGSLSPASTGSFSPLLRLYHHLLFARLLGGADLRSVALGLSELRQTALLVRFR